MATIELTVLVIMGVASWFLTFFGWWLARQDKPGFFMVAGMAVSLITQAEILSTGTGNLLDGITALSATDGLLILIMFSVSTLTQAGLIIWSR